MTIAGYLRALATPVVNRHYPVIAAGPTLADQTRCMVLLLLLLGALFCWLLYKGAVYALPCLAGLYAGQWAHETGAGWTSAVVVALASAILVFVLARAAFAAAPSAAVRALVAVGFVVPTFVVSYNIAIDVVVGSAPSPVWTHIIAGAFALVAGAIALRRLTERASEVPDRPS